MTTLVAIAKLALTMAGETTTHRMARYLIYGTRGYLEWKRTSGSSLNMARVYEARSDRTIPLPDDFVEIGSLGALNPNSGRVERLEHAPQLTLGDEPRAENGAGRAYNREYYWSKLGNGATLPLLNKPQPEARRGYYRVDYAGRQILLGGNAPCSQLYLEYVSDGTEACATTAVPKYLEDYLAAWMLREDARTMQGIDSAKAMLYDQDVKRKKKLARRTAMPVRSEDIYRLFAPLTWASYTSDFVH